MNTAFDDSGNLVRLGRELGRGGEGAVFELPDQPRLVAKVYHQPPDAAKQDKLRLMAAGVDARLREYAAWPEQTLHRAGDGAVIGFTMQRIDKRLPVHMVYSPAQRRELFPKARWDFLLFVARNLAAAFDTLHDHGHVLGDVNQGNALVGEDSRVILIDCDSFQVKFGDALHRCGVGVGHFTPPELQGITAFDEVTRTANHDNFGLALLIFHLLMGGRHPYSGVPQRDDVGHALETDIRAFRYAYAKDARTRLLTPPPRSVPIDVLPPALVPLFEQAFLERGAQSRPTATDWMTALDAVRARLKSCKQESMHVYTDTRVACPWCELALRRVVLFGHPSAAQKATPTAAPQFDLKGIRAQVAAMPALAAIEVPQFANPEPSEPPSFYRVEARIAAIIFPPLAGAFVAASVFGTSTMALGISIGFVLGAVITVGMKAHDFINNHLRASDIEAARQTFLRNHRTMTAAVAKANELSGVEKTNRIRAAIELRLRDFDRNLAAFEASRTGGLTIREFLGKQLIERWVDARVPMIDRIRLRGLGIETAADFDRARLGKVWFNHATSMAALMEWKSDLVRQFQNAEEVRRARVKGQPVAYPKELLQLATSITSEVEALKRTHASASLAALNSGREFFALRGSLQRAYDAWVAATKS